jgi:lipoate-protein ligase B
MHYEHLGLIKYTDALALQTERVTARLENLIENTLLVCEHPPVITCGRSVTPQEFEHLKTTSNIPVIPVSRGGGVTAHEPGQLVMYPILKIQPHQLRPLLHALEAAIAQSLAEIGLSPVTHLAGQTGVWIPEPSGGLKKIASIGLACRRWVTYHGLALNVCNDLHTFTGLTPCGFPSDLMTTVWQALSNNPKSPVGPPALADVTAVLQKHIAIQIQRL